MRAYLAHRDRLLTIEGTEGPAPHARTALLGHDLEAVAAHDGVPERAFVGTFDAGLHRTTDGGRTFDPVGETLDHDAVTAVAVSPLDPETVWVGTEPSRLYRSVDGGDSFESVEGITDVPSAEEWSFPPRPDTHHVRWIEPDPADPDRIYVGIEAGALLYTTDGGATWSDRPPGSRRDNHQLATHPDAPGRVYSAAGDGFAESEDGAEHWTVRHDGLDHRYVWSVVPDPGDPDRVLVSAATGPGSAHSLPGESYCYRRRSGHGQRRGETVSWKRLDGPVSGEGVLRAVLATDGEPGHVYAATNRGCYRSTEFGTAWTRIDVEWPAAVEEQTARGLAVVPADASE
ncbi:glycosyl hydrolase [Salinarchaeum chitinilyticum]